MDSNRVSLELLNLLWFNGTCARVAGARACSQRPQPLGRTPCHTAPARRGRQSRGLSCVRREAKVSVDRMPD